MSLPAGQFSRPARIPNPHHTIFAARSEKLAIGRKCNRLKAAPWTLYLPQFFAVTKIPQTNRIFSRPCRRREAFAVGRKSEGNHDAGMPCKFSHQSAAGNIP